MSKFKITIIKFLIITIIIILLLSVFFIIKYFINKTKINNVLNTYSNDIVQNRIDNENTIETDNSDNLILQIDGEKVIGVIKINQINFEGLVYEGTSLSTLKKGVGHFENSPYFNGNVCLAAHNTNNFWAKLYTLKTGDRIQYTSFLGSKEYAVLDVTQIDETDWTKLENTNDNMLTLITCVKGEHSKRLCVQAIEVN